MEEAEDELWRSAGLRAATLPRATPGEPMRAIPWPA